MVEVADVFRRHGPQYRLKFDNRMAKVHLQAMRAIEHCRTPALGGELYACDKCAQLRYSYHSCGNRNCPKCQNEEATRWLEAQKALLLPVPYFMMTFTLPEELRDLARGHQKLLYGIMFRASAAAVMNLARDPRHLGGLVGLVGVLQSWTKEMSYHPHIHYLVPGGALSPDGTAWLECRYKDWLVPVKALSKLYRGKFRAMLAKAGLLDRVARRVWKKPWTVHCEPVGTGREVIKYLAPYIRRIAITNSRIKSLDGDRVTFQLKNGQQRTLTAEEFIRRLLQHVLPKGFQKVRYYGLLSPTCRARLQDAKKLLRSTAPEENQKDPLVPQDPETPTVGSRQDKRRCEKCGGMLVFVRRLEANERAPPQRT
jgi:hypothetical protein